MRFSQYLKLKLQPLMYILPFLAVAVCLDGTLPAYHFHQGYGSGANSWLVNLEVSHHMIFHMVLFILL